jgi:uncharacterized protein YkwD
MPHTTENPENPESAASQHSAVPALSKEASPQDQGPESTTDTESTSGTGTAPPAAWAPTGALGALKANPAAFAVAAVLAAGFAFTTQAEPAANTWVSQAVQVEQALNDHYVEAITLTRTAPDTETLTINGQTVRECSTYVFSSDGRVLAPGEALPKGAGITSAGIRCTTLVPLTEAPR